MNKISIYGLGQFGFAISKHLADKYKDNLEFSINGYEIDSKVRNELQNHRKHPYHFPNITLPENVNIAYTLDSLIQDSDLIVLAIPAQTIRENIKKIKPYLKEDATILNVAKALEKDTNLSPSEVIRQEINGNKYNLAALAGGTIASEMVNGYPLGADLACQDIKKADELRDIFSNGGLRVYSTDDLIGVEYAGAIKNVIAIGAGIIDGLEFPIGTKTFMITRASKEGKQIGLSVGSKPETFNADSQCWGNDLIMSCMGDTRNRLFGEYIGKEWGIERAMQRLESQHQIAEGYITSKVLYGLGKNENLDIPIINAIYEILYQEKDPKTAIQNLMGRKPKRIGEYTSFLKTFL